VRSPRGPTRWLAGRRCRGHRTRRRAPRSRPRPRPRAVPRRFPPPRAVDSCDDSPPSDSVRSLNPPPGGSASGRMRGWGPSALGELQVELALISRAPDAARGELVEVLGLPVQEAILLEILHLGRDLLEGEAEALGQRVTGVTVGRVRRRAF